MKIYIVGPPGSGKTTLAKKLSKEMNIPYYELDLIVFNDNDNHKRRSDKEINKMFNKIIKNGDWIIEDVGRSKFEKAFSECNKIYYLKLTRWQVAKRITRRWYNQKMGLEDYNYPPTFNQLFDFFKVANSYFKKEKKKLDLLKEYQDKVTFLTLKDLENGE